MKRENESPRAKALFNKFLFLTRGFSPALSPPFLNKACVGTYVLLPPSPSLFSDRGIMSNGADSGGGGFSGQEAAAASERLCPCAQMKIEHMSKHWGKEERPLAFKICFYEGRLKTDHLPLFSSSSFSLFLQAPRAGSEFLREKLCCLLPS